MGAIQTMGVGSSGGAAVESCRCVPDAAFTLFLRTADFGLHGALASCLAAPEVRQLVQTCSQSRAVLASPMGCCCPYLQPRSGGALAAALLGCAAPQLRSLRPAGDFDSIAYLPELAMRLASLGHLEELGPLCIDTAAGPLLLPPGGSECLVVPENAEGMSASDSDVDIALNGPLSMVSVRGLLPTIAAGFQRCRLL